MVQYTSINSTSEIHYPDSELRWPKHWRSRRNRKIDLEDRFWKCVDKECVSSACWLWRGHVINSGYGQLTILRTAKVTAHRFSWFLKHGFIPEKGIEVCHTCNNKLCVNPNHLYAGTKSDNARDAYRDGLCTAPPSQGEQNGRAKLTKEKVSEIRHRYASGETNKSELGRQFGVSSCQIKNIVTRKQWPE